MESKNNMSRRSFMSVIVGAVGGLISLAIGAPAIAYLISPVVKKSQADNWIRISSTSKITLGIPTLVKTRLVQTIGWTSKEEEVSVYVYTTDGRDFLVLSNVCTHLGCRVRWIEEASQFSCPCHTALFDKTGKVITGPPPKPLAQYPVKVEGDQISIKLGA